MSRALFGVAFIVVATAIGACGGSDDSDPKKEEASTEPTSSSGTSGGGSGAATSGGGGTSGSGGGTTGGGTTGSADASADSAPAENCVPKGYAGNDKKIGAYCDKNTPCPFQLDPFLVCTEGHTDVPGHLFCTAPCSKDSECGTGAYCVHDPGGNGCVPTQCGGAPGS